MLETLKMWAIGLPYAIYQTQRIKVAVERFFQQCNFGHMDVGCLSAISGGTIDSSHGVGLPSVSPICSGWADYGLSGQKIYVLPEWFDDPDRWN